MKALEAGEIGAACAICGGVRRMRRYSARLSVETCVACGHVTAHHGVREELPATDYHEQYGERFLSVLAQTRRRQAGVWAALIRRHLPDAESVLDFGAGRGFFLEAAREAGFRRLIGVDSSELSVELLKRSGFEAVLVGSGGPGEARSTFCPDVLTLLDVIEHFPTAEVHSRLRSLLAEYRPRLVVVKVPVTDGLLHRMADRAARAGLPGLIEQLYQVGTDPPHFSYFSRESAERLLVAAGLRVVGRARDRDFDAAGMGERVRFLARLGAVGSALGSAFGVTLEMAATTLAREDSQTLFAVPLTSPA